MKLLFSNGTDRDDLLIDNFKSINESEELYLASPFFTNDSIIRELLSKNCKIKLIVRLCEATSSESLRNILGNKNLEIKYFLDREFHSKVYIVKDSYAVVGSSNLTIKGLQANKELNVVILKDDDRYNEILDIFSLYWEESNILHEKILNEFESIEKSSKEKLQEIKRQFDELQNKQAEMMINKSVNGIGKRGPIPKDMLELMIERSRLANSKPVVCVSTGKKYDSLLIASRQVYDTERGYGYIGDVCKGIRKHYKNLIWRFEEEYNRMTKDEISKLLEDNLKKKKLKKKTVFLYEGKKYYTMKELGWYLLDKGLINSNKSRPEQSVSQFVNTAKKKDCCFFTIKEKRVYFSDYNLEMQKGNIIYEEPLETKVEELQEYYEMVLDWELGDFTVLQLFQTDQEKFFKIENESIYYKSKQKLLEYEQFDEVITKKHAVKLLLNAECNSLENLSINEIEQSNKTKFYKKNEYIYIKKLAFIERFLKEVDRFEILEYVDNIIEFKKITPPLHLVNTFQK